VKSDGDFEDILAEDNPAIWQTNRPAKGGDTGAMLATIIERAAKLKAARTDEKADPADTKPRKARSAGAGTPAAKKKTVAKKATRRK
jgi:hypothetical protein